MSRRPAALRAVVTRSILLQTAAALASALLAAGAYLLLRDQSSELARTQEAQAQVERLRGDVLSGETGLRGFAFTRNAQFLAPYTDSLTSVPDTAASLKRKLARGESARLERALAEVTAWRAEFAARVVALTYAGDTRSAVALARTGIGKRRIDAFRVRLAALDREIEARVDRLERRRDRYAAAGLATIALAALATIAVALLLRRRLEQRAVLPIQDLARAAAQLEAGELSARLDPHGVHEVAVAAHAFNEMAAELERMVGGLKQVDELRSRYVGSASHELRTPLTAMAGHVDELRSGELGPVSDEQRKALDVIARNAERLNRLIDDLLLLARLEAGGIELALEEVEVPKVLREVVEELRPAGTQRNVDVRLDASDGALVRGDPFRLRQAFGNLLSNAIKFSRESTSVYVRAQSGNGEVRVQFEDHGVGIPAAELPRIADRFFRASTAAGIPGTGLGVAITREIVERHGGRLNVSSEEGRGTVFQVTLPQAI